jgi:hypothetical protein
MSAKEIYLEFLLIISPHADSIDLSPLAQECLDLAEEFTVLFVNAKALSIHTPVEDVLWRLWLGVTAHVLALFIYLKFCALGADLLRNPGYTARFFTEKRSHAFERGNDANGHPVFRRLGIKVPHVLVVRQVRVMEVELDCE